MVKLVEVDEIPTEKTGVKLVPVDSIPGEDGGFFSGLANAGGNLVAGSVRGAGSIGATLGWPIYKAMDKYYGDREPNLSGLVTGKQPMSRYQEAKMQMDQGLKEMGADPESLVYQGGKLGTEVLGTAGAGGALGNLFARVAPGMPLLTNALRSGGFNLGAAAKTGPGLLPMLQNLGARTAAGAVVGGVSAGMIDPENAGMGAAIGAGMPAGIQAVGKLGQWAGNTAKSLVQPFTEAGQEAIAGSVLRKAAQGGPTAINAAELVPGSLPTLAEATGNANLAGLQRVARDINPNPFVALGKANAAARNAAFEKAAGTDIALDAARSARSNDAGVLYRQAMQKGIDPAAMTPEMVKEIGDLMSRPAMKSAAAKAKEMAMNEGIKINNAGSMQGMHYTKLALDDQIGEAIRKGSNTEARILTGVKDKLGGVLENISPDYMQASRKFAEMSKPVNQMEVLQNLRLTDAKGNITLSKVQNNIDSLERAMKEPGVNAAKSLTENQLGALKSIRDDLLRQQNTALGRSAGSNTFQNIATNNILENALPFGLGKVVTSKAGGVIGQIGRLPYSGPNEAIRAKLVDAFLDPAMASRLMTQPAVTNDPSRYAGLLQAFAQQQPVMAQGLLGRFNGQTAP